MHGLKTPAHSLARHAKQFAQFSQRKALPVVLYVYATSAIVALLLSSGPPAIAGRIAVVVVNAVDRQALCVAAAIGPCLEVAVIAPVIAYLNAPAAIVRKRLMVWVVAPSNHRIPDSVELAI